MSNIKIKSSTGEEYSLDLRKLAGSPEHQLLNAIEKLQNELALPNTRLKTIQQEIEHLKTTQQNHRNDLIVYNALSLSIQNLDNEVSDLIKAEWAKQMRLEKLRNALEALR